MNKITNTLNAKKLLTIADKPLSKKTSGKRNRACGHSLELSIVKIMKDIGFEHACTTRSESRSRDNDKIDIMNKDERKNGRLPYNLQCKNVVGVLKYDKVLSELPATSSEINVVIHNKTKRSTTNFITVGQYAFLSMSDFFQMVLQIENLKKEVLTLKALG